MNDVYEFYNLGLGDPVPVSGASRLGIGDLLDAVVAYFGEDAKDETEDDRPRIAIIGKPNVGKSSIIYKLLGEERVIVSDIAGTTKGCDRYGDCQKMGRNMYLLIQPDSGGKSKIKRRY